MVLTVFSIRDNKTSSFGKPFLDVHVGNVFRGIKAEIQRGEAFFAGYPDDFDLYQLCTFDDNSGKFVDMKEPTFVKNLGDFKTELEIESIKAKEKRLAQMKEIEDK